VPTQPSSKITRRPAKVIGDRVSIRKGPDQDHKRITLLDAGERLIAVRRAGDWVKVKMASGESGWIRGDFLKLGKELPAPKTPKRKAAVPVAAAPAAKAKPRRKVASAARITHRRGMPMYPRHIGRKAVPNLTGRDNALWLYETRAVEPAESASVQVAESSQSETIDRSLSRNERIARSAGPADIAAKSGVIRTAFAYRGVPYRFGGTTRRGIDCSAFTGQVFRTHGVKLPRTAREQFTRGEKIAFEEMLPGDLVFFHTTRAGISHVGIYIGSGKFVHASSAGGGVRVDSITEGYYRKRFRGARRVKEPPVE
jgi:peptidoglycan endopeptidase LytF